MWDISSALGSRYNWEDIGSEKDSVSIELNQTIVRFVNHACKNLFEIDALNVRPVNLSPNMDLLLVRLTNKEQTNELYGFFKEGTTRFYPIGEQYLETFELVTYVSNYLTHGNVESEIQKLESSYAAYLENSKSNIYKLPNDDIVTDNYLPVAHWRLIEDDKVLAFIKKEYHYILDTFGEDEDSIEDFNLTLWASKLNFSNTYELVEVNCHFKFKNNRFYLLICFKKAGVDEFKSRIIDGKSTVLHNIWGEQSEKKEKDFKISSDVEAKEYLNLFCWAVEGEEGHFILPKEIFDIPFFKSPEDLNLSNEKLKKQSIVFDEKKKLYVANQTTVVYSNAIFEADFEINPINGTLAMLDDSPIASDLPITINFFDKVDADAKVVENPNKKEIELSEAFFESEDWQSKEQKIKATDTITAVEFLKILKSKHVATDKIVSKPIYINDFASSPKKITVENCVFNEELVFVNDETNSLFKFKNCVFNKSFTASDIDFKNSLLFTSCYFKGGQNQHDCSIDFRHFKSNGSLIFKECNFLGHADFTNMNIYGDLKIKGCLFTNDKQKIKKVYAKTEDVRFKNEEELLFISNTIDIKLYGEIFSMKNSTINGDLIICGIQQKQTQIYLCSTFFGGILGSGIEVNGEVKIYDCFVNDYINFSSSKFKQSVSFSDFKTGVCKISKTRTLLINSIQTKVLGYVAFRNSQIEGHLDMSYLDTNGDVSLYGSYIDLYLSIFGLKCRNFDLQFSEINGGVFAYRRNFSMLNRSPLLIEKDLTLSSAKINFIRLEAIEVKGKVIAKTGHFNGINITSGLGPSKSYSKIRPMISKVGGIMFKSINVESDIVFSGIKVGNDKESGLIINYSTIGGSLLFFDKSEADLIKELCEGYNTNIKLESFVDSDFIKENYRKELVEKKHSQVFDKLSWLQKQKSIINNDLNLRSLTIEGEVDLRNLNVIGEIQMDNSKINQKVNACGFFEEKNKNNKEIQLSSEAIKEGFHTKCHAFTMKRTTINSDLELSGLEVSVVTSEEDGFDASGSRILGGLYLIANKRGKFNNFNKSHFFAKINGTFNASVSEIKEVSFTKANFSEGIINLERAIINKFRVVDKTPENIILSGISVGNWDFCHTKHENNSAKKSLSEEYIEVLDQMIVFDKSVYLDIEKGLRNSSEDKHANKVYIAMRKEARIQNKSAWYSIGKIQDAIYGVTTKYGTNFWRLLLIWVVLVIVLSSVYSVFNVGNLTSFEAPLAALQNCIPLLELKFVECNIEETVFKWITLGCTVLSYILLSIAIIGLSVRVSRVK